MQPILDLPTRIRMRTLVAYLVLPILAIVSFAVQSVHAQGSIAASVFADDLDFGNFIVGIHPPKTLTLRICNVGTEDVRFVNSADPTRLVQWSDTAFMVDSAEIAALANVVLKPNDCVNLNVMFDPVRSGPGVYKTTARIFADTRSGRDTSVWSASVLVPGVTMDDIHFLNQWVVASNACTKNTATEYFGIITVDNTGPNADTVDSIGLFGADVTAGYFMLDGFDPENTITPGEVVAAAGAGPLHQRIRFAPTEERFYEAEMRLVMRSGRTLTAAVLGAGAESHISVGGVDFGSVEFQGAYPATPALKEKLIIKALPTRATTIEAITFAGTEASSFWIDPATIGALPRVLNPSDSMVLDIEFRAQKCGVAIVDVDITGNYSKCDQLERVAAAAVCNSGVDEPGSIVEQFSAVTVSGGGAITFRYTLARPVDVRIEVFNASGARVGTVLNAPLSSGMHQASWNTEGLASGRYYCRLTAGRSARMVPVVIF